MGDKWIFLLLCSAKVRRERKDGRKGKRFSGSRSCRSGLKQKMSLVCLWTISLLPLCSHSNAQLLWGSACACDFGQLTLSAFPLIFISYKMTFKGCPMVVLQYVTEGSVSLLTY